MKALVIDGGRNGLAVVRALAAAGIEPHLGSPLPRQVTRFSRDVAGTWRLPDPVDTDRFVAAVAAVGGALADHDGLPLLLPVNDIYVIALGRAWSRLAATFRAGFLTDQDRLARLLEKDRCYALAREVGVPVPPEAPSAGAYLAAGIPFPAVVKPALRNSPEFRSAPPFRVRVCAGAAELRAACDELLRIGAVPVIQRFIPGGDDALYTAGVAALDGRILATFTGRKLRQFPPLLGEASYAESLAAPGTAAHAERLLAHAGFTGIAQVEFKRSEGTDYLMEVNPRSWSWIGLAGACGVNLPAALARAVLGRPVPPALQRNGATWMYSLQDARYHLRPRGSVGWGTWFRQAVTAETHAHWSLRDPLPALAQILPRLGLG
ncbi:MAG TPA: ATP-grasp domain-containing protein [Gemmatimonadales bacterium]|nr:ATP-grasp domain-containing protein [Gemmatimonadales bacterium]